MSDRQKESALARRKIDRGLCDLRRRLRRAAYQKGGDQQNGERESGSCPAPGRRENPVPGTSGESRLQACPNLSFVTGAAFRGRNLLNAIEGSSERLVQQPAGVAEIEMLLDRESSVTLAVIVQDQFFFVWMGHFAALTRGSSARRNFWTARNTLCFAAPG